MEREIQIKWARTKRYMEENGLDGIVIKRFPILHGLQVGKQITWVCILKFEYNGRKIFRPDILVK